MLTAKKKRTRIRLNETIAIARTRSKTQKCLICGQLMDDFGVIIYNADINSRVYSWIHLNCVKDISEEKNGDLLPPAQFNYGNLECTYCHKGSSGFARSSHAHQMFFLHESCVNPLKKDLLKLIEKHQPMLVAMML